MTPYYERNGITIYNGDCLEVMPHLDANSIDTVITDPPYGLEFMGKDWDHGVPGVPFWQAVMRVAKPGAFMLAFGGTRTFHRLVCAIEDAGWEIRDTVMWLYGSGFPKSHNISKAIDKAAGAEREVVGKVKKTHISNDNTHAGWSRPSHKDEKGNVKRIMNITAPATPEAAEWDGWGTALKPAFEPITVAMAPIEGTFANNALTYGVAGLWIEGGRVGHSEPIKEMKSQKGGNKVYAQSGRYSPTTELKPQGRWPANCIHDGSEEVLAGFPVTSSGKIEKHHRLSQQSGFQTSGETYGLESYGDSGSAARFFYCAKASKRERGAYNDHPTVKPLALCRYLARLTRTPTGGLVLDPFMGSGSTLLAARAEGRRAIGIEQDEHACEIAVRRLEDKTLFAVKQTARNGTQARQGVLIE